MEYLVTKLAAWSPTRQTDEQWRNWAQSTTADNDPSLIDDKVKKPKTAAIPAMTRRRLTLWGAMATEVACQCSEYIDEHTPTIFASRHGDTHRTYELLNSIAQSEPLSPTAFSLSVHNSSSGIYSIEQKILANALAIAAGKETLGHSLLEAQNLLAQGHSKVLVVMCDQPLAEFYADDADEIEQPHAFAMVLEKGPASLSLQHTPVQTPPEERADQHSLSMSLQFLKFWYSQANLMNYAGRRLNWRFQR